MQDLKIQWCINQHRNTNHMYDKYLPYEFHLRMVAQVAKDYSSLIPKINLVDGKNQYDIIELACFGHDLIEDCRCTYNDVKAALGKNVADIVYAVTNEKGRNRSERGNEKYYQGIKDTEGAVFVKMCDRIANVQYSKMTKSPQFEMYRNEMDNFLEKIGHKDKWDAHEYEPMFKYLIELFD